MLRWRETWNSRRTFLGSATPLISITIRSNLYPPTCATSTTSNVRQSRVVCHDAVDRYGVPKKS